MLKPTLGASLALLALLASGCGSDEEPREPPDKPPAALLAQAVADPAASGVATIQLDLELEGDSRLAGPQALSLHGPFALDPAGGRPSFDFVLDADVAGFGVDGEVVSTGDDAYVVFFGENYRVGRERVAAVETPRLRVDRWLRDPRYAGADDVAGTDTERIEGTLDTAALARDLAVLGDALGAPGLADVVALRGGSTPAAAWVALEDETIRRVSAEVAFTVPPAERAGAFGITGGSVGLDAQISSVGSEQQIEPPAGGGFQPIEDLIERIGSLAGLAGI